MNPSKQNQKGIWALGVAIVLLAIGGVFTLFDKPTNVAVDNPNPTASSTEIVGTENWPVYQGDGFTFKYPEDFTIDKSLDNPRLLVPIKNYFHTILIGEAYLVVYPESPACPPSMGENFSATTTFASIDKTVISRHEWSGVGAGQLYKGVDYSNMENGKCHQITLFTHSANGAAFYFNNSAQIERTDKQHAEDMTAFFDLIDKKVIMSIRLIN